MIMSLIIGKSAYRKHLALPQPTTTDESFSCIFQPALLMPVPPIYRYQVVPAASSNSFQHLIPWVGFAPTRLMAPTFEIGVSAIPPPGLTDLGIPHHPVWGRSNRQTRLFVGRIPYAPRRICTDRTPHPECGGFAVCPEEHEQKKDGFVAFRLHRYLPTVLFVTDSILSEERFP